MDIPYLGRHNSSRGDGGVLRARFNGNPEPVTEFIVEVSEWSDGTPAGSGDHAHGRSIFTRIQVMTMGKNIGEILRLREVSIMRTREIQDQKTIAREMVAQQGD